jgi:RHS repeat-associated protein
MQRFLSALWLVLGFALVNTAAAGAQVSIEFSPTGGTVQNQSLTVDVYLCSETATIWDRSIQLNGNDVTYSNFTNLGAFGWCNGGGEHWRGTISLSVGSNTLYAFAYDTQDQWMANEAYFFLEVPVASVVVTNNGAGTFGVGQSTTLTARAYDANGNELSSRQVQWSKGGGVSVSPTGGASPHNTTVSGQSAGAAWVTASAGGVTSSAVNMNVMNPVYSFSISPSSGSSHTMAAGATSTGQRSYTISNTSSYTGTAGQFSVSAIPTGVIGTCSVSSGPNPSIPVGWSLVVNVTCPIGATTSSSSPTVTFRVTMTSPGSSTQERVATYHVSPNWAFSVSKPNGNTVTIPGQGQSGSARFRIHNSSTNVGGSTDISYNAGCNTVASCSLSSSVTVPEGSYADIDVPFSVSWVGVNGVVNFSTGTPNGSNPGSSISVLTTPHYGGVQVAGPANQSIPQGNTSGSTSYTVQNRNKNVGPVQYSLIRTCPPPLLSNCGGSPASVSLNDQATSSAIPVTYAVSLSESSGSVSLKATSTTPSATHTGSTALTATPIHAAATVSSPFVQLYRDVAHCIADCFAATALHSTPTYRSIDRERGVTLLYRSDRVRPIATVHFDALDASVQPVEKYSLLIKRADGSTQTLRYDSTTAPELFYQGGGGTTRLAAQFDASGLATGAYSYTAVVRSHWSNQTLERTIPFKIVVVNDGTSEFGAGWRIAQHQRAYVQADGVLIVSGDGSWSFFNACAGTCQLGALAADLSTLNRNADGTYTRRYPDGTTFKFTATGHLTHMADRFETTTVSWTNGRVSSIVDPAGYSTLFSYDANGNISWIATPGMSGATRTSTFTVDALTRELREGRDPDNVRNFAAAYTAQRLRTWTDRRGGVWDFSYGVDSTLHTTQAPTIAAIRSAPPSSDTLPVNLRPTTTTTSPGRDILTALANGTSGSNATPVPRGLELRASVTNARNHTQHFVVGKFGSPTKIYFPLGDSAMATYNDQAQTTQTVSPSGHTISYTWIGPKLQQVHDVTTGHTLHARYESTYNRPDSIWDGSRKQRFTYNGAHLATTSVNGGPPTTYAHDAYGRVTQITDAGSHVTKIHYANVGLRNTDSVQTAGNGRTWTRYDLFGRVRAVVGPDGVRDSTAYDALNRVTASVNGLNHATSFAFGDLVYLTGVTDANGQTTTYTRNPLGWVTSEQRPGSANPLLTAYDQNGNVAKYTNRRGQVLWFGYDQRDRIVTRSGPGMSPTTFAYRTPTSSIEGFASATNGESADTLYFNTADRLVRSATWAHGNWYRLTYDYDTHGRRTGLHATSDRWTGSKSQTFGYTATGALSSLTAFDSTTALNPGAANEDLATAITYPNGLVKGRNFGELHVSYTSSYNVSQVHSIVGHQVGLDLVGRVTRYSGGDGKGNKISYDNARRLQTFEKWDMTPETCPLLEDSGCTWADSTFLAATSFTYDPAGSLLNGVTSLSVPGNRVNVANGKSYTYDADGNVLQKSAAGFATQTFAWDALGQLTSVTSSAATVTFAYDAFGRRVRKSEDGSTTFYLHDGDNLAMELDASGSPIAEYAYWGLDRPHAIRKGGATYYFALDPISGNVRGLIAESNHDAPSQFRYAPFGEMELDFDQVGMPLRFAAREYDAATGLYYMRARYYDPTIGRFISEDPIGLDGGLNLYAYTENDPVNGSDPFGLKPCSPEAEKHGWVTVETKDGEECIKPPEEGGGATLPPVETTALANDFWRALWLGWANWGAVHGGMRFGEPVDAAMPDYIGGPGLAKGVARLATTRVAQRAFRPGTWLNSGRFWRIGYGKDDTGHWVLRAAGEWLQSPFARRLGVQNGKIDFIKLSPLNNPPWK